VESTAVYRHGKPAVLQTQPVPVAADQLRVNIEGHHGTARAALLDEGAGVIEGFSLEDCLPIAEDDVRATVRWEERRSLEALRGRQVIVMLQMVSGTVWSFRI